MAYLSETEILTLFNGYKVQVAENDVYYNGRKDVLVIINGEVQSIPKHYVIERNGNKIN